MSVVFLFVFFVFVFFFLSLSFSFLFGFYGPFKNISLISSRSFIKGGRKLENPGKNHHGFRVSSPIHQVTGARSHVCIPNKGLRMRIWRTTNRKTIKSPFSVLQLVCMSEMGLKWCDEMPKKKKNVDPISKWARQSVDTYQSAYT